MSGFAQLSDRLRAAYGRYSTYIDMVWKFLLAFACFFWIRSVIGFSSMVSNPFLLLILALVCMIMPLGAIPFISGILIIGQAFGLGLDAGAVTLVLLLVIYLLFLRFVPDDTIGMILLPVTMFFGFGLVVPMVMGLKRRASSVFAAGSGVVVYYFMANMSRESAKIQAADSSDYATRLQLLISGAFSATMVMNLIAVCAAFILVYSIRRLEFSYSRMIAVLVGAAGYVAFVVIGNTVAGTSIALTSALISAFASAAAAVIIELLIRPLDYTRSERLEFEDDDYYYYVKAIPKASVSKREFRNMHGDDSEELSSESLERPNLDDVNFEERLEDSLRNL